MTSPSDLVDHLAYIVRKDPRGGGARCYGMKILQRGSGRKVSDDWPKDSTVSTEVAEILFGIQFDGKKAFASCFEAAEAVTRHLGLEHFTTARPRIMKPCPLNGHVGIPSLHLDRH